MQVMKVEIIQTKKKAFGLIKTTRLKLHIRMDIMEDGNF